MIVIVSVKTRKIALLGYILGVIFCQIRPLNDFISNKVWYIKIHQDKASQLDIHQKNYKKSTFYFNLQCSRMDI